MADRFEKGTHLRHALHGCAHSTGVGRLRDRAAPLRSAALERDRHLLFLYCQKSHSPFVVRALSFRVACRLSDALGAPSQKSLHAASPPVRPWHSGCPSDPSPSRVLIEFPAFRRLDLSYEAKDIQDREDDPNRDLRSTTYHRSIIALGHKAHNPTIPFRLVADESRELGLQGSSRRMQPLANHDKSAFGPL